MDRISAILIFCIAALLTASGLMVYNTLDAGHDSMQRIESVSEHISEEENLRFNDDTSITNMSGKKLWVRVRIISDEGVDVSYDDISSQSVEQGEWVKEGIWYYSCRQVNDMETTEPVIDSLSSGDCSREFSLQVEAVDEERLTEAPENGVEAFEIFNKITNEQNGVHI